MQIHSAGDLKYRLPNSLSDFQIRMYIHLINWKWKHITEEPGYYRGRPYDALLPSSYKKEHYPIYRPIRDRFLEHQKKFKFKSHRFIGHMASSQAACANLFLPILEDPIVAVQILSVVKPDIRRVAIEYLDSGYRIEFWDEPGNMLNDHNKVAGTDSDIAIAYYDKQDNLNLWLIEHKLTEKEFTTCGGYRSKGNKAKHRCDSIPDILRDANLCYYHSVCKYRYWPITLGSSLFRQIREMDGECPFKGGLNQLWRNQLLGLAVENSPKWPFKKVFFSVVYHPKNESLVPTMREFGNLFNHDERFSYFTSDRLLDAATKIDSASISKWRSWYEELYFF